MADTNIWVAAAITPHGVCGRLLSAAIEGRWQPVISQLLVEELTVVLSRPKFRRWLTEEEAAQFVADLKVVADEVSDPPASATTVTADPGDEFLVALASTGGVAALVSGDPHLTELIDLDPPVLTPAAFLDRLAADAP